MLTGMDYQVMTAASVDQGLKIVRSWPADVVVLDILMPDRDGLDFIMATRDLPGLRIVAVTGGGSLGPSLILKMAAGLGAHATLAKPVTASSLQAAISG